MKGRRFGIAGMPWLKGGVDHENREQNEGADGKVRDPVEEPSIGVAPHDLAVVHQDDHENENKRKEGPIDHLGIEHNGNQGYVGEEDDCRAEKYHERVEAVELRGFGEFPVNTRFPAERLTDRVGGGQGEDGSRE